MLIGREKEQKRLLMAESSERSEFVAVFGRRRVGKTFLIRETFKDRFCFYHTGLANAGMSRQLTEFKKTLCKYGSQKYRVPKDWYDAFDLLSEVVAKDKSWKKIVFLDELPWMDTAKSGFVSALEHFWNGWARTRKNKRKRGSDMDMTGFRTVCTAIAVLASATIRAAAAHEGDSPLKALPPLACKPVEAVPGEAPSLLPDGRRFKLVWNDEFHGTSLDESKWYYRTHYWGRRAAWFAGPEDAGAVVVTNGMLHMPLQKRPDGQFVSASLQTGSRLWDEPLNPKARPGGWPWMKRSSPKFQHRFGYYECRCRLQQKPGWWSAFWMQSPGQGATLNPRENGLEHDIMESFEPGELRVHAFFYGGYQREEIRRFQTPRKTPGIKGAADRAATKLVDKTEFHTFGLLWEPDGYSVFIDGVQDGEKVGCGPGEAVSQTEEFLLVTTEAKDYKWKGTADPRLNDAVGDEFIVDFVRVYDFVDR